MPVRKNVTLDKTLAIAPNSTDQLDLPRDHVIDDILLLSILYLRCGTNR